jgi:hypothetical protein
MPVGAGLIKDPDKYRSQAEARLLISGVGDRVSAKSLHETDCLLSLNLRHRSEKMA